MSTYDLFKYKRINKNLIDSLVNGYLYYATPISLNDPFDCRVNLLESIKRAIGATNGTARSNLESLLASSEFVDSLQKLVSNAGICSFSTELLKSVLWSHYANEHRGVCLLFKIPKEFINWDKNKFAGISTVEYGDNRLTEAIIKIAEHLSSMNILDIVRELTVPIFTSKGEDWEYEKEIRIIRSAPGPYKIQMEFLSQICFGLRTSDSDKKLITKIIDMAGYKVTYCEITKSNTDFGLHAIDL